MGSIRARQFMFVQYLDHLNIKVADMPKIIGTLSAEEWAYIIHDKDIDDNGKKIKPHVHVIIKFTNVRNLTSIAEAFKTKPQYIEVWKGRINNAYSYLLHLTSEAKNKHRYDANEVVASFDFMNKIDQITKSIKGKRKFMDKEEIDELISEYAEKLITYDQLREIIGVHELAKKKTIIDNITKVLADQEHQEWLDKFKNKKCEVHWIWGKAGVGKTRYAVKLLEGLDYVVLGSSRDYFQNYHGERFVVLNDLRPNDFPYSDLLRILDPYEHDKQAPRRYHDVKLNLEMLIITTPYSPYDFYENATILDREIDSFEQLKRRIHEIKLTADIASDFLNLENDDDVDLPF